LSKLVECDKLSTFFYSIIIIIIIIRISFFFSTLNPNPLCNPYLRTCHAEQTFET